MAGFTYRDLMDEDNATICSFPQTQQELFYIGPKFVYPLTPEQLRERLEDRFCPTVITDERNAPIGFANLYDVSSEDFSCWLGNVIVASSYRGQGASEYLIQVMLRRAALECKAQTLRLYCHNTNTRALLFYIKQGFTPCGSKIIENYNGEKIAAIEMKKDMDSETES